jgi:hypothetical protein
MERPRRKHDVLPWSAVLLAPFLWTRLRWPAFFCYSLLCFTAAFVFTWRVHSTVSRIREIDEKLNALTKVPLTTPVLPESGLPTDLSKAIGQTLEKSHPGPSPARLASAASLSFQRNGQVIPLTPSESQRVIREITEVVGDGGDFTALFDPGPIEQPRSIEEMARDSFLHVHYQAPTTLSLLTYKLIVEDIWVDIHSENLPGPTWIVNAGKTTYLGKDKTIWMIALGLDPAIFPNLPTRMQTSLDAQREKLESHRKRISGGVEERGFVGLVMRTPGPATTGDFRSIHWVTSGSPAASAGIKPHDYILSVDGQSTAEMKTLDALVHALQGAPGTPVRFELRRIESRKLETLTITRGKKLFLKIPPSDSPDVVL